MKRTPKVSKAALSPKDEEAKSLAKSADPAYTKFTTYIKRSTHKAMKVRMVDEEREMSDLIESLLSKWLRDNNSNGH